MNGNRNRIIKTAPLYGAEADGRAQRAAWRLALLARDNWLHRERKRAIAAAHAAKVQP